MRTNNWVHSVNGITHFQLTHQVGQMFFSYYFSFNLIVIRRNKNKAEIASNHRSFVGAGDLSFERF